MASMRAVRLNVVTHALSVEDVEVPEPGADQVLLRVAAAGVCLSDVHLIDGSLQPAYLTGEVVTLGHEVAGVVDRLGPGVTTVAVGDRVTLQAGEGRAGLVYTRGVDYDGGWAEFALARVDTLVPIPDELPFEQAAIIPDAVSTPWSAVVTTARVRPGEAVGVWGVGGLGTHGVQVLRMVGAAPVIALDPLPEARERALEFGADLAIDPAAEDAVESIWAATGGRGLAVALDFAGVPAVRDQAVLALGYGGRLVLVGLASAPLQIADSVRFGFLRQQVRGHYGSDPGDVPKLVRLVSLGRLSFEKSVTATFPLSEAPEVVAKLRDKEGFPIRFVLTP